MLLWYRYANMPMLLARQRMHGPPAAVSVRSCPVDSRTPARRRDRSGGRQLSRSGIRAGNRRAPEEEMTPIAGHGLCGRGPCAVRRSAEHAIRANAQDLRLASTSPWQLITSSDEYWD